MQVNKSDGKNMDVTIDTVMYIPNRHNEGRFLPQCMVIDSWGILRVKSCRGNFYKIYVIYGGVQKCLILYQLKAISKKVFMKTGPKINCFRDTADFVF